jgi:hypothetical protein
MKKLLLGGSILLLVFALGGCQLSNSKSTNNTDNADSATIQEGNSANLDISAPPVPPEPTRPQ